MKSSVLLKGITIATVGFMLALSSCKKDEALKPAPTVSLGTNSTSALAGATVSTTVTVDAPEGGKTLAILVNGVADNSLPAKTLDGTTSQVVDISYTIPAAAVVGSIINITFTATDKANQVSPSATFAVTVSAVPAKTIVDVTGSITTDTHWTADKIYRLNGFVRVGTDAKPGAGGAGVAPVITATATLTIDAGTVIYGKTGTPGGGLVIQRGSKIIANGTSSAPIVFTSEKSAGSRKGGDWSGVIICGKARNNIKASASTGLDGVEELEGAYGAFHGGGVDADDADNSGSFTYVRIEFAGYPINPNQEVNGLTLGSVGSGTTIDHVQVTYANDDSFEWFGGTVNARHLIAYKGIDDDFDTDNGFSGQVQFGLGIRDALIADQSGSNGFESDNDANGSANTPFTNATFSNMTIIGGKATSGTTINIQFQNGAQIRRNSRQ
ncbi:MAG: Ig-like domain repeat protein, partial [Cyclobacteriaceae bacterium]|nr:Ig-like domain repeat protein [Cyclobacteriaceae bacterium]